ncbi:MAG: hypothetical protein IKT46_07805 [Clostridia bacterium]|nr:hypothetical protein [Clostridia bacterium]
MKHSILYKIPEHTEGGSLIYDLSVDRCIANISSDTRKNEYFCHVVSSPLKNAENILYRRAILEDLCENKGLLAELKTLFSRYDKLKADWLELKGTGERVSADRGSEAMLDYIYSSLKVTALFPKTIISFFSSIAEVFDGYSVSSEGLLSLRDYARELLENKSLKEIETIASHFAYNSPEDYDFELVCSIGDSLSCISAEISSVREREKKKNPLLSILTKKKKTEGEANITSPEARAYSLEILGEAMYRTDRMLSEITDSVYDSFYGLSRELDFYEIALKYADFLMQSGKSYCYPGLGAEAVKVSGLYDLFLLTEDKCEVYPNDADFTGYTGVLIRGKNNTGKTTFLRSVAIAQLFAQAGLPIAASQAELPVYGGIYTHFSSAEEEFTRGDISGRFEGEVKAIAGIMDKLQRGSLVILNETFQTTAYDEGSVAIEGILRALNALGCQYIFVTHLTQLFDMLGEDTAKLESANGDTPFTIKKL